MGTMLFELGSENYPAQYRININIIKEANCNIFVTCNLELVMIPSNLMVVKVC